MPDGDYAGVRGAPGGRRRPLRADRRRDGRDRRDVTTACIASPSASASGLGLTSPRPLYVLQVLPETRTVVVGDEDALACGSCTVRERELALDRRAARRPLAARRAASATATRRRAADGRARCRTAARTCASTSRSARSRPARPRSSTTATSAWAAAGYESTARLAGRDDGLRSGQPAPASCCAAFFDVPSPVLTATPSIAALDAEEPAVARALLRDHDVLGHRLAARLQQLLERALRVVRRRARGRSRSARELGRARTRRRRRGRRRGRARRSPPRRRWPRGFAFLPPARLLLAAAEAQERRAAPARCERAGQARGRHERRAALALHALGPVGIAAVQQVRDHEAEHRVAQELERLVVPVAARGARSWAWLACVSARSSSVGSAKRWPRRSCSSASSRPRASASPAGHRARARTPPGRRPRSGRPGRRAARAAASRRCPRRTPRSRRACPAPACPCRARRAPRARSRACTGRPPARCVIRSLRQEAAGGTALGPLAQRRRRRAPSRGSSGSTYQSVPNATSTPASRNERTL